MISSARPTSISYQLLTTSYRPLAVRRSSQILRGLNSPTQDSQPELTPPLKGFNAEAEDKIHFSAAIG